MHNLPADKVAINFFMKQLILLLSLAAFGSQTTAQQKKAFTMPAIFGQVTGPNEVYRPITLTGGNTMLENDVIINATGASVP